MKKKYLDEMVRQLRQMSYECILSESEGQHCNIYKNGEFKCILFENALLNTNAFPDIYKTIKSIKEFVEQYEQASPLAAEGLREGYKMLLEYNRIVLAMKELTGIDGFEFVTWEYSKDHKSVNLGHYHTDYVAAKEDFAHRSGLVDLSKMFSENQMKLIYNSLVSYVSITPSINLKTEKQVGMILDKITEMIPEIIHHESLEDKELVADDGLEL